MIRNLKLPILLLAGLLSAAPLRADEKSKALLGALTAEMGAYTSYQIDFTAAMPGEFGDLAGRMVVSGDRYYIGTGDVEVFFDGQSRWTYTRSQQEVILEKPSPASGPLENPARFFKLYDRDFTHTYQGTGTWNGRKVDLVELRPREAGTGYTLLLLRLDAASGRPLSLRCTLEGASEPLEIVIEKISPDVPAGDAVFTFDRKAHKGVEVIDFR